MINLLKAMYAILLLQACAQSDDHATAYTTCVRCADRKCGSGTCHHLYVQARQIALLGRRILWDQIAAAE